MTLALEETIKSIEHGQLGPIEQTSNHRFNFDILVPRYNQVDLNIQRKVVHFDVS